MTGHVRIHNKTQGILLSLGVLQWVGIRLYFDIPLIADLQLKRTTQHRTRWQDVT
jgi:hypothetical protein